MWELVELTLGRKKAQADYAIQLADEEAKAEEPKPEVPRFELPPRRSILADWLDEQRALNPETGFARALLCLTCDEPLPLKWDGKCCAACRKSIWEKVDPQPWEASAEPDLAFEID